MSSEFERIVIGGLYAKQVSICSRKWILERCKSSYKTAVAAFFSASASNISECDRTSTNCSFASFKADGILSKMIYNNLIKQVLQVLEVVLKLQEQLLQTLT
jgi:hypothetical protein